MKRILSILITVILVFNTLIISYADDGSFVSNAVLSVRGKIDIPENYTEFTSRISLDEDSRYACLSWYGDADGSSLGGQISVNVNEEYVITEFTQYFYGEYAGDYKLSRFDRNEAEKIAVEFARRACPEYFLQTQAEYAENFVNRNYEPYKITFYRYENGLPCYENYIQVTVNAYNGRVASMYVNWDKCQVVRSSRPGVSSTAAKIAMFDKIGLVPEYAKKADGSLYIRYAGLSDGRKYISAYTGEVFNTASFGSYEDLTKTLNLSVIEEESIEACIGSVTDNRCIPFDSSYILSGTAFYGDSFGKYAMLEYKNSDDFSKTYLIDVSNGDIRYYSCRKGIVDKNLNYSESRCKAVADSFCNDYGKSVFGYCRYLNSVPAKNEYGEKIFYFNYPRMINGIVYNDNGILIGVSAATGEVVSVEMSIDMFGDIKPEKTITPGEAYEVYIENAGFQLQYVIAVNNYRLKEMRAVYAPDPRISLYVDAVTGELVNENGLPYNSEFNGYIDIYGDESMTQINKLMSCGVFDKTERFMPDDNITLCDFLLYMCRCIDCVAYESIDDVSAELTGRGIVTPEEIAANGFVTTEKGIKYIVSYLGYDKIAELKDTYTTGFVDEGYISEGLIGYAAIAKGLKIFSGNAFMPQEYLKRNVVAQILYNLISN